MPRSDEENESKASSRPRRASESDTMLEVARDKNVDILQMLSKAQDEYDKVACCASTSSVMTALHKCELMCALKV